MALLKCVEESDCKKPNCTFVHPGEPGYEHAGETYLYRKRKAAGTLGSRHRYAQRPESDWNSTSRRPSATGSNSGWNDPAPASGKGWQSGGSPEPPSKGGWDAASPNAGGWGASGSGGGGGGWGNASPTGAEWGDTSTGSGTGGGWGDSGAGGGGGWGDSKAGGGGWGDSGADSGWGNLEPSSRRTSGSFDRPKSPRKPPPVSPRGDRDRARSPVPTHSAPSSTSKDRDRDRYKEKERDKGRHRNRDIDRDRDMDRDRDRDRDRGHDTDMSSPSRSRRSRRSPSPEKGSSPRKDRERRDRPRSPEPRRTATNTGDAMEIDPPSTAAPSSSLSTPAVKESATAPTAAPPAAPAAPAAATTPTTAEMPISISFPRPVLPLGVAPLGAAPRPVSLLTSTPPAMPPPAPPQNAPAPLPPPPVPAPPAPAPPAAVVSAPEPPPQAKPPPPPPTIKAPTKPSIERPYEWIELLETLINQHRALQTCKQQVERAEHLEKVPVVRGAPLNTSHPSAADTSKALTKMRDRLSGLQAHVQDLMGQFAVHMERFYQPSGSGSVVSSSSAAPPSDKDAETIRQLTDYVSKLQSEMKLVEAEMETMGGLKKVAEEAKAESKALKSAIQKAEEAKSKALEVLKKDIGAFTGEYLGVKAKVERMGEDQDGMRTTLEQVRSDVQVLKDGKAGVQSVLEGVKQEVKDVKLEVSSTKAEVQSAKVEVSNVKKQVGGVVKDVGEIKTEMEKLKKQVSERLASVPAPASTTAPSPTTATATAAAPAPTAPAPTTANATTLGPGKRNRNGNGIVVSESPSSPDVMDVDEAPPAKRARVSDASAPAPAVVHPTPSATPLASPVVITTKPHPDQKQLHERVDDVEDYIANLENELIQVSADVKDRLEEFAARLGVSSDQGVVYETAVVDTTQPAAGGRSESAPPGSSPKLSIVRAGRSSAPPEVSAPAVPVFMRSNLAAVPEEEDGGLSKDLNAVMGELVKFWGAEGEWPTIVRKNLCKALGVASLDEVWTKKSQPTDKVKPVNGRKEEGEVEESWLVELKEEQAKMREEMQKAQKEREEQAKRMEAMLVRLEKAETALDKSAKERETLEKENKAMKEQQVEQNKLVVHLQSVIDSLPKPHNGILTPEAIMQDAMHNGISPVQREVAAIKSLAVIVPSLMELAGVTPEN